MRQGPFRVVLERGYIGSPASMKAMKEMARSGEAHPDVRRWAVETVRQVTPRDYLSEMAALYYATAREIRYVRDPAHTELVSHPAVTLSQRAEDCDGMSAFQRAAKGALDGLRPRETLAALGMAAGSIGNQAEYTAVGFEAKPKSMDPYTHVFLRVRDSKSGEWAVMDPVAGPKTTAMLRKVRTLKSEAV